MKIIKPLFIALFFANLSLAQCYTTIKTTASTTIGLHTDGSLWGWGVNQSGSLGLGLGIDSFNTIFPNTQIGTNTDWSPKYSMKQHVLAIKNNGTLWAWGFNFDGQCGNGTSGQQNYVLAPQQIDTATWQDVATGLVYSLGVRTDGTLWAWGDNEKGQLGNGTTTDSNVPIQIGTDNNWSKVFTQSTTSFAIKTDGSLWSWGISAFVLGRTDENYTVPGQVGTDTNWDLVAPSEISIMGVKTNGTLWVWGQNGSDSYTAYYGNGQADTNNYENNPTQVGNDTDWKSVTTDTYNFRALKTNGTVWSWGQNMNGVLGDGTILPRYTPIQIGTDNDWIYLHSFRSRVFALKPNSSLYNWGYIFPNYVTSPAPNGTDCSLSTVTHNTSNLIKVTPNPTKDKLTLLIDQTVSIKEIIIYNALGKIITNIEPNPNVIEAQIDLTSFADGLYYLRVNSDVGNDTIKIIKN